MLSLVGAFEAEINLVTGAICLFALLLYKRFANDLIPILVGLILGALVLYYNITNTGYIYSYNNKWFVVFLIMILYIRSSWLLPLTFIVLIGQTVIFNQTEITTNFDLEGSLRLEEYLDNIAFFIVAYLILKLIYNHTNAKNFRLDKSNELQEARTSQLIQSNEELERFAYIASHDLKSPLRNIVSFASLLEKDLGDTASPKQKEYLSYIKGGSEKLNVIVEDVLDYSKISNHNVEEFQPIDLNEVIVEIKEMIADTIDKRKGDVYIENVLSIVKGRKTLFLLLFKNLIKNGLKYNESENPKIEIYSEQEGDEIKLVVSDNGIGIDSKYQKSIFDMFSRLHAESKYEGSGLGLAVCKKIMDSLNGRIELMSQLGKGSGFYLFFQVESSHQNN